MSDAIASLTQELAEQIKQAARENAPLRIEGSGSKAFYGRAVATNSQALDVSGCRGVISYDPTELVITARAGTPLSELEATLTERGQMLGFEPPHFGPTATLGGAIASGLSGPRRPYAGSARDFVLGVTMLNGQGEVLRFGGQVMKNVAGYDLSRLLTGSMGTLGVILEVSLKILPLPAQEHTLSQTCSAAGALQRFSNWASKPYPVTAAVHDGESLYLRLSGAASGVKAAAQAIGGDRISANDAAAFWQSVREHTHPFFKQALPLWRLSLPPASASLNITDRGLLDWGGAQRWLYSEQPAETIFNAAKATGGHATLFRGGNRHGQVFQALEPIVLKLHRRLKQSFDPQGIFNSGRLYSDL